MRVIYWDSFHNESKTNNADSNITREFILRETTCNSHISNGMIYLKFQIAAGVDFNVSTMHGHQQAESYFQTLECVSGSITVPFSSGLPKFVPL